MWVMVTMIGAQEVTVFSHVLLPRAASAAEADAMIKEAAAEIFAVLKRLSIRTQ
jgi:hypothetical protein